MKSLVVAGLMVSVMQAIYVAIQVRVMMDTHNKLEQQTERAEMWRREFIRKKA